MADDIQTEVYVRATASRKKQGGIWRANRFFTLDWHLVSLTEAELDRVESDPNLEVSHEAQEATVDELLESSEAFAVKKTMAQSLLEDGEDDDGEEEEKDEDDDEDDEGGNAAVDALLKRQSKTERKPAAKSDGTERKVAHKSTATKKSEAQAKADAAEDKDEDKAPDDLDDLGI